MATILITGGSGLIGQHLTEALRREGHIVRWLSRSAGHRNGVAVYAWDVNAGTIDTEAVQEVDHVVHLAGAGIADQRWTPPRVQELIDSRVESARLLLRAFQQAGNAPRSMVSASGVGYYGASTSDQLITENDPPGRDTIARISSEWERAVDEWGSLCRVVKLRTPLVLAKDGGALPRLAQPARFGLGAAIGSGKQWMPWVHIDDLIAAYQRALNDDRMSDAYNVVAGNATNAEFMRTLAQVLGRPFFLPRVPGWVLRTVLGEMASLLLEGSRVSGVRLEESGMRFGHTRLRDALTDLLRG
ncbi:MAG: TIGR01777 family protein [Flavobacteriales bacterium]|nr:TIGR01777 family protein [Flavobacteriales bacterium]